MRHGENVSAGIVRMLAACPGIHRLVRGQTGKAPIGGSNHLLNALAGLDHHGGVEEAVAMVV